MQDDILPISIHSATILLDAGEKTQGSGTEYVISWSPVVTPRLHKLKVWCRRVPLVRPSPLTGEAERVQPTTTQYIMARSRAGSCGAWRGSPLRKAYTLLHRAQVYTSIPSLQWHPRWCQSSLWGLPRLKGEETAHRPLNAAVACLAPPSLSTGLESHD